MAQSRISTLASAIRRICLTGSVRRVGAVDIVTFKFAKKNAVVAFQTLKQKPTFVDAVRRAIMGGIVEFADEINDRGALYDVAKAMPIAEESFAAARLSRLIGDRRMYALTSSYVENI